jgi:hypothetical protein
MADMVHIGASVHQPLCGESPLTVMRVTQEPEQATCPTCLLAAIGAYHSKMAGMLVRVGEVLGVKASKVEVGRG